MTEEKSEEKQKPFPLEKILTASAREYADSRNQHLSEFRMVGVHHYGGDVEDFCKEVPQDAGVVVGYRISSPNLQSGNRIYYGTALIFL